MGYNVVVFGSSGFIGGFVTAKLRELGHYVIGVDLVEPSVKPDVFIRANAADIDSLRAVMSEYNPDAVVNLVGLPHIPTCERNPHMSYVTNVYTAHNILEISRSFNVKKYVFTSSAAVYGSKVAAPKVSEDTPPRPTSIYGWHKLEAETEARAYTERYGITTIVLRLFNVYGADPRKGRDVASIFLRKLLNREKITVWGPYKIRDFMYIEDAALAIAKAVEIDEPGKHLVVNIGTGQPTRIIDLLEALQEALGIEARYEVRDEDDRSGYYADITRMKNLIGIKPTPFREGIRLWLKRLNLI